MSLTLRWPWVIAFTFGLLHGFGFAGALSDIGLPEQAIPLALLFFNVGVEVGQLLFIAGVLAVGVITRRIVSPSSPWTDVTISPPSASLMRSDVGTWSLGAACFGRLLKNAKAFFKSILFGPLIEPASLPSAAPSRRCQSSRMASRRKLVAFS